MNSPPNAEIQRAPSNSNSNFHDNAARAFALYSYSAIILSRFFPQYEPVIGALEISIGNRENLTTNFIYIYIYERDGERGWRAERKMTNVIAGAEMAGPTVFPSSIRERIFNAYPMNGKASSRRQMRGRMERFSSIFSSPSLDIGCFVLSRKRGEEREKNERIGNWKNFHLATTTPDIPAG